MRTRGLLIFGSLAIVVAVFGWRQELVREKLHTELEVLMMRDREAARLSEENRRLSKVQVSPVELANLRADHATALRLRGELEQLKARERSAASDSSDQNRDAQKEPATAAVASPDLSLVPSSEWKNAGRSTPEAAIETALWAAVGGDVSTLAEELSFNPSGRAKIEAAFAGLPGAIQAEYGTPERLIALLAAKDMSVKAMGLVGPVRGQNVNLPPGYEVMRIRFVDAEGMTRNTVLSLRQAPDGWQIDVPNSVVDRYLATVASSTSQSATGQ